VRIPSLGYPLLCGYYMRDSEISQGSNARVRVRVALLPWISVEGDLPTIYPLKPPIEPYEYDLYVAQYY